MRSKHHYILSRHITRPHQPILFLFLTIYILLPPDRSYLVSVEDLSGGLLFSGLLVPVAGEQLSRGPVMAAKVPGLMVVNRHFLLQTWNARTNVS